MWVMPGHPRTMLGRPVGGGTSASGLLDADGDPGYQEGIAWFGLQDQLGFITLEVKDHFTMVDLVKTLK